MSDEVTLRDVVALTATDSQWKRFQRVKITQPSEEEMALWRLVSIAMAFPFGTRVQAPQPKFEPIDTEEQARFRFADAFLKARSELDNSV